MKPEASPLRKWLHQVARNKMLLLMLGGAVGTCLRYWVSRWFNLQPWTRGFPLGTLVINISGSFILAVATTIIRKRLPGQDHWNLLICTGFCGGFTTFSTFELETHALIDRRNWWYALLNVLGSVLGGFVAVMLGVALANFLFPEQ